jgi:hypothetical protein
MTLESDSAPEKTTKIFDMLQRDAAKQDALDVSYRREYFLTSTWFERRGHAV